MQIDNKDAITNKYSSYTPEAAAQLAREHEVKLQDQISVFQQS